MERTAIARLGPVASAWIAGAVFAAALPAAALPAAALPAVALPAAADPAVSLAQSAPEDGGVSAKRMLELLDQNGDGVLDHEEFVETPRPGGAGVSDAAQRSRAQQFDNLDQDGDGRLSEEELAELPGVRVR